MISIITSHFAAASSACQPKGSLFGLPTWYKYLEGFKPEDEPTQCIIRLRALSDVWLILSAVIEILLRVAALGAIVMIVYAGISFITSEGQPDKVKKAISMAISASIGLAISIGAAATVSFIAGRFN
ncbi:MAG: hypothetical protein NTX11_01105 [Candidatus Saccharibacteria bacterium]|nr:hypothetical protein [Candidatus Saccharibacteria bacterium]